MSHQARLSPTGTRYDMRQGSEEWNALDAPTKEHFKREAEKLNEIIVPIIRAKVEAAGGAAASQ